MKEQYQKSKKVMMRFLVGLGSVCLGPGMLQKVVEIKREKEEEDLRKRRKCYYSRPNGV